MSRFIADDPITRNDGLLKHERETPAEGGKCPDRCGGMLELRRPDDGGCTCFRSPPCSSYTGQYLACSACDWREDEP